MLRRLGIGLIKGLLVGGLMLAALLFGLKMAAVPVWAAYLLAVGVGALTGLVAGKPIWQKGARLEAGLKAVAGMILGALGMFALHRWGAVLLRPDLLRSLAPAPALPPGQTAPALTGLSLSFLPMISLALGLFFELDNTPTPEEKNVRKKLPPPGSRARVSSEIPTPAEIDELLDSGSQQSQRREHR
ncbi:MAG: hypothetical protein RMJ98_17750 [Myxococcales bacterium]|nr:hypothetical protein [Polyangiaceae bacterium]MDW8251141.1 hypothetical protein [Myxococcales bacterium]